MSRWSKTSMCALWCAAMMSLSAAGAMAQSAQVEGRADIALVGGQVHTISGEVIDEGVVVISEGGTILAVGEEGAVAVPEGAQTIDVSGKVVTPGLFDAYSMLGTVEIEAVPEMRDTRSGPGAVNASYQVGESFHSHSAIIPVQRAGGVTDVIVAPQGDGGGGVVSGQGAHVELHGGGLKEGEVEREGVAQYITLGSDGAQALKGSRGALASALRELYEDAAYYDKNKALFDTNRMRALAASASSLQALEEGKRAGQPVVFEASLARDILWALDFAKEQELQAIILGAEEAWMVRDELKASGAAVILDATSNLPATMESTAAREDNAALCEEAGVPVMLATFSSHNSRRVRQMAGLAVRGGMTREGALRAVTLEVAKRFGSGKTHGSLEVGKSANVVVWSGDPFEFSTKVERMYIDGEEVSLESRQGKLLERYRALERRGDPAKLKEGEGAE